MKDVVITGIGMVPVGEHWEISLRSLAARAVLAARKDAPGLTPQAMYIGNMLSPVVSHQSNLGALLADACGLHGIEAFTTEAADASGGCALRVGALAIESGFVDCVVVVGVEKTTDMVAADLEGAMAESLDYDFEGVPGSTPFAQAAMLMRRYLHETGAPHTAFYELPLLAHANGAGNPFAMYRKAVKRELIEGAEALVDPMSMWDFAPAADGAAALILTRADLVPPDFKHIPVRVTGSAVAIDTLALHDRRNPLDFGAVEVAAMEAMRQAGCKPGGVDFLELPDTSSIYALLALEAAGFARRGEGWRLALDGSLGLRNRLPVNTLGGMKARGNPLGASGVYQAAEIALQLRGEAGPNQLKNPQRGMAINLGGPASTAAVHVLER